MSKEVTRVGAGKGITRHLDAPPEDNYDPFRFLLPQQLLFVQQYLVDFNGKAAAIRAGYSERSASAIASNLLNTYDVAYAIQSEVRKRGQRIGIDADMVLRELGWLALSSVGNYEMDDEGFVRPAEGAPSEVMRAVKGVKREIWYDDDGNKHVKTEFVLHDKVASLKMLAQHLGMFIERHAHLHAGADGGPIVHQHWVIGGKEITFT